MWALMLILGLTDSSFPP